MHPPERGLGFREMGREVGIDDEYDGRAVALADLDRDGDLDAVVANQNGPLLVYRNERPPGRHWLGIELVGRRGNTEAHGAEVSVEFAAGIVAQVVTSASGFAAQNDRLLHFGLGEDPGDVRVRVRWPGGEQQLYEGLALDRAHVLTEGRP